MGYVSPEAILPLPKAAARKKRIVRKKVTSKIVTDTPEKLALEKAQKEKEEKKAEMEKRRKEREEKRALKAEKQVKTKKSCSCSSDERSTEGEADDGLEKKQRREKERAEKKKRSGNEEGTPKGSKQTKRKKKVVVSSSSDESDFPIPLCDSPDFSSDFLDDDDNDECEKNPRAGDFVIVKFAGKKSSYNYVGFVDAVEGDELNAKFLKKTSKTSTDGKPNFTIRENDEGVILLQDVLEVLPAPKKLGGTARREHKFVFPVSVERGNVM